MTAGKMIGIAAISRNYPTTLERLGDAVPNLLTYLGVASVLGVAGSLLLSRRVKRQTLGMEPSEITGLVENPGSHAPWAQRRGGGARPERADHGGQ
jgi:two-component system CitB family sensor kinase